jgi:hypothetical protein
VRNDLCKASVSSEGQNVVYFATSSDCVLDGVAPICEVETRESYRTAALCSEVWQKRKRTSRRDFVNAYLADIVSV